ncbi:MAG: hypothetical protein JWO69_1585 [Thermoleophilia bacterium]|nr:hypothetical protein [Thermoleophilia bacterium]
MAAPSHMSSRPRSAVAVGEEEPVSTRNNQMGARWHTPAAAPTEVNMAIRIRVYPQNGLGALGGMNRMGGAVSASTFYNTKLSAQRQVSNLQIQYERALANEKIERVRLEERLKNPYAMMGMGGIGGMAGYGAMPMQAAFNPYAGSMMGQSMLGGFASPFLGGLGRFF